MDKIKILGVGTTVTALVISMIAATVAFAAYNEDLTISGSATAKGANWSVVFTDLQEAVTGNDNGMTSTAKEVVTPGFNGDTAIETYKVELQTPGDYVSYNFTIENAGDFPAKIDTSFEMPIPECTKGAAGIDADATNVCNNLEYTLKYVSDASNVKVGDTFGAGESKVVQLKIYYKKTVPEDQLPTDDVAIGNLDITIPFIQY